MQKVNLIPLKKSGAHRLLEQLAKHFGTKVDKDCQRLTTSIPEAIAEKGEVIAYDLGNGLDSIIFKGTFREGLELIMQGDSPAPIAFYTMAKGNIKVSTKEDAFTIAPLQCTIHGGFGDNNQSLSFRPEEDILCMITLMHKEVFFKNIDCETLNIPEDLLSVVTGLTDVDDSFLFQDIFHLPAINALNDIFKQKNQGLLNSSFVAAKVHETLFLLLNEYKRFEASDSSRFVREEKKLEKIRNAESILISHLDEPPTIPELARMVGTNQQSLKQGFRQMFGETINQYLTNKRMEQAGILIQAGKLSMGEVAEAIGYGSASYFSRRFKEKYGVCPKKFNQRSDVQSAKS